MVDPLISTIIPTYNRAHELARAVDSALGQSYPAERQEIIVIDDGSTDQGATEREVSRYGDRVRYLRKENGGVSSARNLGMAEARGELFAFLDSDDEWLPEKLRKQTAFLAAHPHCGLVLTDFIEIDSQRRPGAIMHHAARFRDDKPNLIQALRYPGLPPSTVMVRRTVIEDVGGFDTALRTAEDIDLHLRVAPKYGVGLISEPLVRYKMGHDDGLSHGRRTYRDFMSVICKVVDRHAEEIEPALRHQLLLSNYLRNARGLIVGGWYPDGVKLMVDGARHVRGARDAWSVGFLGYVLARHAATRWIRKLARPRA